MRKTLASSRHRKAASGAGTQWSKGSAESKDVREGSGAIPQGFVSWDKEFGTYANWNRTSLKCFTQEGNMVKFMWLKMTMAVAAEVVPDQNGRGGIYREVSDALSSTELSIW